MKVTIQNRGAESCSSYFKSMKEMVGSGSDHSPELAIRDRIVDVPLATGGNSCDPHERCVDEHTDYSFEYSSEQ